MSDQSRRCAINSLRTKNSRGLLGRSHQSQKDVRSPTTTTSQKSIAIHLQFVLQYASNLYCSTFGAPTLWEREILSILLPFVSQYASHLCCNAPPICIAVLLEKSWWLWSPGCSSTNYLCYDIPLCFECFRDRQQA